MNKEYTNKRELVAVYGTLMKGFHNHHIIEECNMIKAELTAPEFQMLEIGEFPGIIPGEQPIHVELYEVFNPNVKRRLDYLEGCCYSDPVLNLFNKKEIDTSIGKATIYIWNGATNYEVINSGNYRKFKDKEIYEEV